jgi:hypothetical protein
MRRATLLAALAIASPAVADDPQPVPPDPELLEFLGEMAGEDPYFVAFMSTHAAKRALKDAEKDDEEESKEDDDE